MPTLILTTNPETEFFYFNSSGGVPLLNGIILPRLPSFITDAGLPLILKSGFVPHQRDTGGVEIFDLISKSDLIIGHYGYDNSTKSVKTGLFYPTFIGSPEDYVMQLRLWRQPRRRGLHCEHVNISYSDLQSANRKTLITPEDEEDQFHIREIFLSSDGTNFSGGDRSIHITDGTTVWASMPDSGITAMSSNKRWGDTELAYSTPNMNASSQPGSEIYAEYVGGTTDFIDGNLNLTVCYERVADAE